MFNTMTARQYNARVTYYTGEKGQKELFNWNEFMFNAVQRYVESGDATHLNNVMKGAANVGRYRASYRIMSTLSAHPFNKQDKLFHKQANKKKLAEVRENWEAMFIDALTQEEKHSSTTPTFDWSKKEQALIRLVSQCVENGVSTASINRVVKEAEVKAQQKAMKKKQQEKQVVEILEEAPIKEAIA